MKTEQILMQCGHIANAIRDGKPVCVICSGIDAGAEVVVGKRHDGVGLEGRVAQCPYCSKKVTSKWNLPFFEHRPDLPTDSYYCGCFGWN